MAKSIAHTIESLKQAMYTASPVPGKLQVQLDLDRIARELTEIEAYLIDKHGLAVATTLVVPLVKLREKVLWYSRMAKPMPYEKFLALRGEADAVLNRIKMAATTSPAPVDHEDDPPLDYEDESILRALARKAPRLLTEYEIEADTRVSRRTISKRLANLLNHGLVVRPKGPKSGTTITEKGKRLIDRLPKDKTSEG